MKVLLDTHVFLWWRSDDRQLGLAARRVLGDPETAVLVSAVVGWEIVIKRALGRLELEGTVAGAVAEEGFSALPVSLAHVDAVSRLPDVHRDPFDRLLIAQAMCDRLTLVTADPHILAYDGLALLDARRGRRARR